MKRDESTEENHLEILQMKRKGCQNSKAFQCHKKFASQYPPKILNVKDTQQQESK